MNQRCDYRKTIDCRFSNTDKEADENYLPCELCLAGQQIDSIELLISAIMEKHIDKLEDEMHEPE